MDFETILFKKEEHIATITMNRPERRNALNPKMAQELGVALDDIETDDDMRVMIITGAGGAFCSGADIDPTSLAGAAPGEMNIEAMRRSPMMRGVHKVLLGLRKLKVPTIAMVNGPCVGAGFEIALCCDMRVGSENARFMCGFVKLSLYPFGSCWLYPRVMGLGKAFELLFTGDAIDGKEAERIGILNKAVPTDNLEEEAMNLARKIAKGPPIVIRFMKSQVYQGLSMDLETVLDMSATYEGALATTSDLMEGLTARFQKREPVFKGK
jgi:enoyl-CoA hydratase/carnithine racemase